MDAEHRHELKSNELVEFLGHLPEFLRKYSNQIIGVILILVALIAIPLYSRMRTQSSTVEKAAMISKIQMARESLAAAAQDKEGENSAAALTTAIDDLEEAAQTTEHADLAALALLEASELLRAELHLRSDVSADTVSANLSRARTHCEQAFEKAQSPTLKGLAELGLGLCAEEAGEYDKAREIYQTLIAREEYAGTGVIEQARGRLDSMEDNSRPVVFAETPEESSAESAQAEQPPTAPEAAPEQNTLPSIRAAEPVETPAESAAIPAEPSDAAEATDPAAP